MFESRSNVWLKKREGGGVLDASPEMRKTGLVDPAVVTRGRSRF